MEPQQGEELSTDVEAVEGAPPPEPASAATASQGEGAATGGPETLESLRAERDAIYQRLQRVSAEFENYQKRSQRERAKWGQDAVRSLLEGFLPVADSIELAVAAFDREVKDVQSLRQGVSLVREELLRTLAQHAVTPIQAAPDTPYDPERHQAVTVTEVEGLAGEQVAFQARTGYMLGDVVLRPAQVGVKKPKSA